MNAASSSGPRRSIALVLAGGVAKGAFEAGALVELLDRKVDIVRIVAASSGGLNATVLAAAIRKGAPAAAGGDLATMWERDARWSRALHVSLFDAVRLRGLSDQEGLLRLLRERVLPSPGPGRVDVRFVLGALRGAEGHIGDARATTYEAEASFTGEHFDTPRALEEVFAAAVASAAFPGAFAPANVPRYGPCIDGGTVNNTPIKHALDGLGRDVDAIVVLAPTPQVIEAPRDARWSGLDLADHVGDMLVNERLYRDLKEAHDVNVALAKLAALPLTPSQHGEVLTALGWTRRRQVELVCVRPEEPLPGGSFSALTNASLRRQYVAAGRRAAERALVGWG